MRTNYRLAVGEATIWAGGNPKRTVRYHAHADVVRRYVANATGEELNLAESVTTPHAVPARE